MTTSTPVRTCSVVEDGDRCGKPHVARGYCRAHWNRWRRNGDPLSRAKPKPKPPRRCDVEDCTKPHHAHGYCDEHAHRFKRYGDPLGSPEPKTFADRFWEKVDKENGQIHPGLGTHCWIWTAGTTAGYGKISIGGRDKVLAHRYTLGLALGMFAPWLDHLVADHRCHQPLCVRPDHLRAVRQKGNVENYSGLRSDNTSGYRGVTWDRRDRKWRAYVTHNGHTRQGYFADRDDAAAAALAWRNELHIYNDADRLVGVA